MLLTLMLKYISPLLFLGIQIHAQPVIQWQKAFGGTNSDQGHYVLQTKDGGYALVGTASSTDGDVVGQHGGLDIWFLKLDSAGAVQWKKTYGGSDQDGAAKVLQTEDGGYLI